MKSILLVKKFLGLVEMTSGLVNASFSLPEWQAVKRIFFAPCNVKISGKVHHDNQNLVVAKIFCQLLGPLRIEDFYCNKKNLLKNQTVFDKAVTVPRNIRRGLMHAHLLKISTCFKP